VSKSEKMAKRSMPPPLFGGEINVTCQSVDQTDFLKLRDKFFTHIGTKCRTKKINPPNKHLSAENEKINHTNSDAILVK
jgi:hypothetical protein